MKSKYRNYFSISDLNKAPYNDSAKLNFGAVKICVIDNEDFKTGRLNNEGFSNVRVRTEFGAVDDYVPYDIILVDVSGVATTQYKNAEGAGVAEALIDKYPEKIVAICSARDEDEIRRKLKKYKDIDIIHKEDNDELISKLKDYTRDLTVPYYACLRLEKTIERQSINATYLEKAIIEHGFVASILERNENYFDSKEFESITKGIEIVQNLLSIAASVLTIYNAINGPAL